MSQRVEIQAIGELLPLDEGGNIINLSRKDKIAPPWSEVVQATKEACLQHFGEAVHSIYVRGSVARGKAIEGISDVDAFAVLHGEEVDFGDGWVQTFQREAKVKYPFCQKVELELIPYSGVMNLEGDEYMADRLMIKTQSACIYGLDLAPTLPGFKPDKSIAFNVQSFDKLLAIAKQKLSETENANEVKDVGTWIMKRFLRTGFELVMEREGDYTRDLYMCYKIFSKYYPDKEDDMRRALELAINPADDKRLILEIVDGFGQWMSQEVAKMYP